MPIVIQKFGGKLLETAASVRSAAAYVCRSKDNGDEPVVVVSAPGRMTDQIIAMAKEISPNPDQREMDMMLSVGERMTMSLLAMAINDGGKYHAVSFTGSQVGIITDSHHTDARIIEVKGYRLREALAKGEIPIIAGFQGISREREITTLGRGGSDATAVALAAALGGRCELIKEKGGVFSADPDLIPDAVPIANMDYATLEALSAAGAKVVQPRAAALAQEHKVVLDVKAPSGAVGTLVSDRSLGSAAVAGVVLKEGLLFLDGRGRASTLSISGGWSFIAAASGKRLAATVQSDSDGYKQVDQISVVGWGGRLEGAAVALCRSALAEAGVEVLGEAGVGGTWAVIVGVGAGRKALRAVHKGLLSGGFLRDKG